MSRKDRSPLSPLGGSCNTGPQTGLSLDDSEDEDEIFFGPVTPKEKEKATKFKRRTEVFHAGFRFLKQRCSVNEEEEDENGVQGGGIENKENETACGETADVLDRVEDDDVDDDRRVDIIQSMMQETEIVTCDGDKEGATAEDGRAGQIAPINTGEMRDGTASRQSINTGDDDSEKDIQIQGLESAEDTARNETLPDCYVDAPFSVVGETMGLEWTQNSILNPDFGIAKSEDTLTQTLPLDETKDRDQPVNNLSDYEVSASEKIYDADVTAAGDMLDCREYHQHDVNSNAVAVKGSAVQSHLTEIGGTSTEEKNSETGFRLYEPTASNGPSQRLLTATERCLYSSPILTTTTTPIFQNITHGSFLAASPVTREIVSSPITMAAKEVVNKYANPSCTESKIEHVAPNGSNRVQGTQNDSNPMNCMVPITEEGTQVKVPVTVSSYDRAKEEMVEQRRQLLAEKKARLAKIRKEREQLLKRMEMDVSKTSSPTSIADSLTVEYSTPSESTCVSVFSKLREIESNCLSTLTLTEAELDMVTKLHTMKNRQYQVYIDHQNNLQPSSQDSDRSLWQKENTSHAQTMNESWVQHQPECPDTTEARVRWRDATTVDSGGKVVQEKSSELGKSILHQRPEGFVYPYSCEVPPPVVVNRSRHTGTVSTPFSKRRVLYQ